MIAGKGWHNQTGERAAEEFISWLYFRKSFSLLSCMPMGRWGGQSLANRQLRYGHRDPLQWVPLSHTSLNNIQCVYMQETTTEPTTGSSSFACNKYVMLVHLSMPGNTPSRLSNTSLVCHSFEHKMCYQETSAANAKHTCSHAPLLPRRDFLPADSSWLWCSEVLLEGIFFFL